LRAGADKRQRGDGEARKTGVAYANRGGRRAIRHDSTLNVLEQIMAYHLEGRLLEVCNCRVLCPCWIGEDPDFGTCDTIVSWHFDKGKIGDVDVAGRTIALIAHIPGNILQGNWKAAVYVDDKASAQQKEAILNVYTGKLGGPVGDLAKLIGDHVYLLDGVGRSIQIEIQPDVEEMLMVGRVEQGSDHSAVLWLFALAHRTRQRSTASFSYRISSLATWRTHRGQRCPANILARPLDLRSP